MSSRRCRRIPHGNTILPLDIPGVALPIAAYGYKPLRRAMANQPVFGLHNFDTPASPIPLSAEGLNGPVNALAEDAGVDPVTGIGGDLIAALYDHSGHSNDALQHDNTDNLGIKPDVVIINGKLSFFFSGILAQQVQGHGMYINVPDSVAVDARNHTIYAIVKSYTTTAGTTPLGNNQNAFYSGGKAVGGGYWWWLSEGNDADPSMSAAVIDDKNFDGGAGFFPDNNQGQSPFINISKQVISFVAKSDSTLFGVNETFSDGDPLVAGTITGGWIGQGPFGSNDFLSGRLEAMLIYNSAHDDATAAKVRAALYRYGDMQDYMNRADRINVLVMGASFDQGHSGDPSNLVAAGHSGGGYGWVEMLADKYKDKPIIWNNIAMSGNTILEDTANYNNYGTKLYDAGAAKNIILFNLSAEGNSSTASVSPADQYTQLVAEITAIKNDHPWDILATYIFNSDDPDFISDLKEPLIANAESLGIVILTEALDISEEGTETSTGHPNIIGYKEMMDQIDPVFSTFLD